MSENPPWSPPISTVDSPPVDSPWRIRLGAVLLGSVWLMVFYQLSLVWIINAQYAHGWLVPFLCIYLALKASFPPPISARTGKARATIPLWVLGSISLLLLFPAWIIREANSDWRLINMILVGLAMLLTFAMLHQDGGWPKVKAAAFPILFFLVAVPWPLAYDLQLTLWLQGKVSSIIVDLLLLLGSHVELEGHVIHAPPFGNIGVDEACSGIHGLQASFVVSLFLGHFYRFSILQRTLFCFIGLSFALLANVGRAFILAFYATRGKIQLVEEWHNMAGLIETGCILLGLIICAQLIKGRNDRPSLGEHNFRWTVLRTASPMAFSIAGLGFLAATLVASFMHYFLHERDMFEVPPLQIDFSAGNILSETNHPSKQIEAQLHYTEAQSTRWQELQYAQKNSDGVFQMNPYGEYWQGFACSWKSGGACMAVLSTHSPDACLPLAGLRKISPAPGQMPEIIKVPIGGYEVPFEGYEFEKDGKSLFVFRCFWPRKTHGNQFPPFPQGGYNFKSRVKSAWNGKRNVGGTMVALCVGNVFDMETAKRKLIEQVR
ncbi:MAG: exosortase/archaeosortase family protein, partial [Opitutales bacterium]